MIFVSYSSADAFLARKLATDLEETGIDVWLDQWNITVGDRFEPVIERGLANCDALLVLLTRTSVASEWVDREWRTRLSTETDPERISVIPVRAEVCDIPDFLAQRPVADISGGSYPLGFRQLLEILSHFGGMAVSLPQQRKAPEPQTQFVHCVSPISVEMGVEASLLFEAETDGTCPMLEEAIPTLRAMLSKSLGIFVPGIRFAGYAPDLRPDVVVILLDGIPEAHVTGIKNDPKGAEALLRALEETILGQAHLLMDIDQAHRLVSNTLADHPEIPQPAPDRVSWPNLTQIFERLLKDGISLTGIADILKAFGQHSNRVIHVDDGLVIARQALQRQFTQSWAADGKPLDVVELSAELEGFIRQSIVNTAAGIHFDLHLGFPEKLLGAVRDVSRSWDMKKVPLMTHPEIRAMLARLVAPEFPNLTVLAHGELSPDIKLKRRAHIHLPASALGKTDPQA